MNYEGHSGNYDKKEIQKANPVGIDYLVRNEQIKEDFTSRLPAKQIIWIRVPWGQPYGATRIGDNKEWLDEKLKEVPEFKEEVDNHECDHCPIELNTRYIAWERVKKQSREEIIEKVKDQYDEEKLLSLVTYYQKPA